eukprot:5357926-Prymnesium_polylepis.1
MQIAMPPDLRSIIKLVFPFLCTVIRASAVGEALRDVCVLGCATAGLAGGGARRHDRASGLGAAHGGEAGVREVCGTQ